MRGILLVLGYFLLAQKKNAQFEKKKSIKNPNSVKLCIFEFFEQLAFIVHFLLQKMVRNLIDPYKQKYWGPNFIFGINNQGFERKNTLKMVP